MLVIFIALTTLRYSKMCIPWGILNRSVCGDNSSQSDTALSSKLSTGRDYFISDMFFVTSISHSTINYRTISDQWERLCRRDSHRPSILVIYIFILNLTRAAPKVNAGNDLSLANKFPARRARRKIGLAQPRH